MSHLEKHAGTDKYGTVIKNFENYYSFERESDMFILPTFNFPSRESRTWVLNS